MLVAAELHNPLQSICSLTSKLRTPLMSLTWQRTTVAETCKLKAERINKKTSLTKLGNKKLSSSATPSYIISQCLVSSCIILDFQTENTIREFDTWDGHHCRTPWCCKLHASHRSRRKHPQRYNEPNSLVTSTTSCTNLLHTRTIQCKECVLRSLRPRLLRLTSKHHCRIDMQTEQWSSLWTSQFPHRLSHQTNQAPHVLARIH